jgi:hypothetical protein
MSLATKPSARTRAFSLLKHAGANSAYWAPAGCAFAATAVFALLNYYPILYFDHWDILPLYQRLADGTLRWGDLFAPHGTHWHAGGYAVMLTLAPLTGLTQGAEVIVNQILTLATCIVLYALLRNSALATGRRVSPFLFAIFALFLFSPDQSENWLWGWQVSVFLNVAGAVVALTLLSCQTSKFVGLAGAMLGAAIAIYSFATGLALLPIGLVVLWGTHRRLDGRLVAWALFSVAVALHYKIAVLDMRPDYVASITPQHFDVHTLTSLLTFTLALVGSAVGRFTNGLPVIAAVLGLCVGAYAVFRMTQAERAASAGLLGLGLYGLGAASLIALGRLGFDNPSISRYITFANFFWMGVIALTFVAFDAKQNVFIKRAAPLLLSAVLLGKAATIANVLGSSSAGLAHAAEVRRAASVICRMYPDIPPGVLAEISAPYQHVEKPLAYLAEQRLSIFRICPGRPQ